MVVANAHVTATDFAVEDAHPDWCGGCGDFGILNSLRQALAKCGRPPYAVAVVSGIGCSAKTPHYLRTYGLHSLHGRALNVATGVKLANMQLTVIAIGGDGDGYGIGAGYFVNSGRRNLDITYFVNNNSVYGLTKGQASPTLRRGLKTKSMSEPAIQEGVNPIGLAIASGYTFVARGYAMAGPELVELMVKAIAHRGTALVDILQPCPVYNDLFTVDFYRGKDLETGVPRIYRLADEGYDGQVHDPANPDEVTQKKQAALLKSYEWGDRIPTGVLYQIELPTYEDAVIARRPSAATGPLYRETRNASNVEPLLEVFR
ncbi:MAG: 2-oxoacid:ferredoxin oxidoreductase subunit beta [Actinobacteria bacterium]|nr:2-oxoacid:ferredoxin oxidoreductase subunit beta [Actinomycetota bacterium]